MKTIFILLLVVLILPVNVDSAGTTGAEFLKIGIGARPVGMGNTFAGVADDINSIYWNPAGLSNIKDLEASFMHYEGFENIRYEFIGCGKNIENFGVVAGSISYLHMDELIGRNMAGRLTNNFTAYDLAAVLSYSYNFSNSLSTGLNIKIIHEQIEKEKATGFGVDVGALYKIKNIKFGLSIQNFGSGLKFIKEREPLPFNIKIGSSYIFEFTNFTTLFALDIDFPIKDDPIVSVGSELSFFDMFSVRSGYKFDKKLVAPTGLSVGGGIKYKNYSVDYAYRPFGDLGNSHYLSLTIR